MNRRQKRQAKWANRVLNKVKNLNQMQCFRCGNTGGIKIESKTESVFDMFNHKLFNTYLGRNEQGRCSYCSSVIPFEFIAGFIEQTPYLVKIEKTYETRSWPSDIEDITDENGYVVETHCEELFRKIIIGDLFKAMQIAEAQFNKFKPSRFHGKLDACIYTLKRNKNDRVTKKIEGMVFFNWIG